MAKEPVSLSDWIQVLSGTLERGDARFMGFLVLSLSFLSISMVLLSLLLSATALGIDLSNAIVPINIVVTVLPIAGVIIIIINLIGYIHPSFEYTKARTLLRKILKEGEGDIDYISRECFKERKNMFDSIKKHRRLILISLGAISITAGIICWIYATYLIRTTDQTIDAAGYYSLGIGFFSVGIAFLSYKIAKESDKKMEANANESFLKIWDKFGDNRILFLKQIRKGDVSSTEYMAWKCETYLDRAFDLMDTSKIKLKNREKMFNVYCQLLRQFPWQGKIIDDIPIKDNVVTLTDTKNLLNAYKKIIKNHLYDERSNELIHLFHPYVKDINPKISVEKQIDAFINEIDETRKILEEIQGKKPKYLFIRLEQAKQLTKQKKKKKGKK